MENIHPMETKSIPLFPLYAVMFPHGNIPLKIFEPRYLEMISERLKSNKDFGICLIRDGSEIGKAAETYEVGTLSEISYFERHPDGLLGITAHGKQRFNIVSKKVQANQLTIAEVELLPEEAKLPVPEKYNAVVDILRRQIDQLAYPFLKKEVNYDDLGWVSYRLSELLPLKLEQKQHLLKIEGAEQRLEHIRELIEKLALV